MFKKKKEKELEPQYYMSETNMPVLNYRVYYMGKLEKILTFLFAFAVGAAVGYLFYGGIGKDVDGNPTQTTHILNITISGIVGLIAAKIYMPMAVKRKIEKRHLELRLQFRELLDTLNTSIGSGRNVTDSFKSAYDDLRLIYPDDSYIVRELLVINAGLDNNIPIERLLKDFGERSNIDDVSSFANIFETSYRKGGNIKDIIDSTQQIISDKMEVELEIQTIITSSATELNIMSVMPIALIAMIKLMSADFAANFVSPAGLVSSTIALVMIVIAYVVGKWIMNIKV